MKCLFRLIARLFQESNQSLSSDVRLFVCAVDRNSIFNIIFRSLEDTWRLYPVWGEISGQNLEKVSHLFLSHTITTILRWRICRCGRLAAGMLSPCFPCSLQSAIWISCNAQGRGRELDRLLNEREYWAGFPRRTGTFTGGRAVANFSDSSVYGVQSVVHGTYLAVCLNCCFV